MIEIRFVRKDHIAEKLIREQILKIAGSKSLCQFPVVNSTHERASANHSQLTLFVDLNGLGKAMQARVTTVVRNCVRSGRSRVRLAAIWITKLYMLTRRLQRGADRIVVRACQCRRLM